jgi:hypothetical protein
VSGVTETREEDFMDCLRGTVSPGVEVEGGHFVDGVDAEEEVQEGGYSCEGERCACHVEDEFEDEARDKHGENE